LSSFLYAPFVCIRNWFPRLLSVIQFNRFMVPYARPAGFAIHTAQNLETPFLDEIITYDDSIEPNLQIFRDAAMRSGPIENPSSASRFR